MATERERLDAVRKAKLAVTKAVKSGGIRKIDDAKKALAQKEAAARAAGLTDEQIDAVVKNPTTGTVNDTIQKRTEADRRRLDEQLRRFDEQRKRRGQGHKDDGSGDDSFI